MVQPGFDQMYVDQEELVIKAFHLCEQRSYELKSRMVLSCFHKESG